MTALPWSKMKADARMRAASPLDVRWAEEIDAKLLASCHTLQRDFVRDPGRRVSGLIGRGGGKTTGARARAVRKMARIPRAKLVYIATTREHARELMWDPLKDLTERLGIDCNFNEERLVCTFKRNGSRIRLFGADDMREIDKLRGQSFHEVQIDEAASHREKVLDALIKRIVGPRLGDFGGCIVLFGTPGHILSGLFYDATRPGSPQHRPYERRDESEFANWTSWSSHAWTLEDAAKEIPAIAGLWREALIEKADQKWSDDHPVWLREYRAQWAADDTEHVYKYRPRLPDGTPWNEWDPERVGPMRFAKLPTEFSDWLYAYGMDLGSKDPFALNIFAASPSDPTRTKYHVFGFERPEMYARRIAQLMLGEDESTPTKCSPHEKPTGVLAVTGWPAGMVCDMTHLGGNILDELSNVYGIQVDPAEQKSKLGNIELVNGELVDGRVKVLKGSLLAQQLGELQWMRDEFGVVKENKAQSNHSADTACYGLRLLANIFEAHAPTQPPQAAQRSARIDSAIADLGGDGSDEHGEFDSLLGDGGYDASWG